MRPFLRTLFVAVLFLVAAMPSARAITFDVEGYGLFPEAELRLLVRRLQQPDQESYDYAFIENALYLIHGKVENDGYLRPDYTILVGDPDGGPQETYTWDGRSLLILPTSLETDWVRVHIEEGILYHYEGVEFTGLTVLTRSEAEAFFMASGYLFASKADRKYAPSLFRSSLASLQQALVNRGYRDAKVNGDPPIAEDATEEGAVRPIVEVEEGTLHRVVSYQERLAEDLTGSPPPVELRASSSPDTAFTPEWEQDTIRDLRNRFYRQGYPDVRIRLQVTTGEAAAGERPVTALARVEPGPRVRVGEIDFDGKGETRKSVLDRRMEFAEGDWLDPLLIEDSRYRLLRLDIFSDVDVETPTVQDGPPPVRDVTFQFEPGGRLEVALLGGWGTYDFIWAGVEVTKYNLWGRAHTVRFRATQSLRTTSADLLYRLPELFGERLDGLFTVSGLRREEVSFLREEYGFSAGFDRYIESLDLRFDVRYRIDQLRASDIEENAVVGADDARVAAIELLLSHDRRNDPLYPTTGYRVRLTTETAGTYLGANVNYQRLEFDISWHRPLWQNFFFHTALRQNAVFSFTDTADIPFNRRFFPGGDNSIRGYPEGEASPRLNGVEIGAEQSTLLVTEFEQALSPRLSIVALVDQMMVSQDVAEFPGGDYLLSVGLGLRYRTPLGPARLEGAYNVQRRDDDPSWNLVFALGYPY